MPMDWDPVRDVAGLPDAIDRLLQTNIRRSLEGIAGRFGSITLDITESEAEFRVRAALPGVRPEAIQVTVHGDRLTLRGEAEESPEGAGTRWLLREHPRGTLERTVALPSPVDADKAEATYENGLLLLTLPKVDEGRPRRITVVPAPRGESKSSGVPAAVTAGTGVPAVRDDAVGEASDQSFPASDPPSWTPGKG